MVVLDEKFHKPLGWFYEHNLIETDISYSQLILQNTEQCSWTSCPEDSFYLSFLNFGTLRKDPLSGLK